MLRTATASLLTLLGLSAEARVLHTEKSLYRNITVLEENGERCMRFGRVASSRQTCLRLTQPDQLVFDYTRMMLGALYLQPQPRDILVVGLGGGTLPMTLRKLYPQARIDTVEIDPAVTRIASRFFGFQPDAAMTVAEEDGRVFVKRQLKQGRKYELVMLDAFDHDYIPEHLLTREFLLEVRGILAPRGVLAANTFSSSKLYQHESATYAAVFGDFYNLQTRSRVILLRQGGLPARGELEANAARLEKALPYYGVSQDWLLPLFKLSARDWPASTRVLTDQYAPSNLLNAM